MGALGELSTVLREGWNREFGLPGALSLPFPVLRCTTCATVIGAPWGCAHSVCTSMPGARQNSASPFPQGSVSLGLRPCLKSPIIIRLLGEAFTSTQESLSKCTQEKKKGHRNATWQLFQARNIGLPETWALNKLALPRRQPQEANHIQATFMALPAAIEACLPSFLPLGLPPTLCAETKLSRAACRPTLCFAYFASEHPACFILLFVFLRKKKSF